MAASWCGADEAAPSRSGASRLPPGAAVRLALCAVLALLAGCRQDMHDQPRYDPFERSSFFADDRASRRLVPGVVARGHLDADRAFFTGTGADGPVRVNPLPAARETLLRGRERYDIFCAPCHDRVGTGQGMIVLRGFKQPPTLLDARMRAVPDGYLFHVISNGFGTMSTYAPQVPARDRWAIVAYIRALQLSQHAALADAPPAERARLGAP